ncbi:gamma-glutamylcyclotransferase family protein [Ruminococcus sp.]|uniref:gamma-glutamylcyclotransferase family protein n=1 Tax=Ruminococcus sp. TaxID=41978 RepID=UPI0025CE13BD|nr:gamma-glutamylcyclotransferase family protein [Ruminococcus sp.]
MDKKKYYLAYGSNLNVRQMRYRCPTARIVGISVIKNYELLYKGSKTGAYLTIEPKKNGLVPIAVWEVTADDEKRLDIYEGCPNFYYKKEVRLPVKLANGDVKKLDAFVYIMHEERSLGVPTLAYVRTCEEGYSNFGFDTKFLDAAYEISAKEEQ